MPVEKCVSCDARLLREISSSECDGLNVRTTEGAGCVLLQQNPMVPHAFLSKFYRNFYQRLQRGSVPNEAVIKREVEGGQRVIEVLESEDFPKRGFLDIGCSAGRVLSDIGGIFV